MATLSLGVLCSGSGTNLQAIIDAIQAGTLDARIAVVITNKENAGAIARAEKAGVKAIYISHKNYSSREQYDKALVSELKAAGVNLVVLAGFMRIVTHVLLDAFSDRVVNIHPAILPAFPGVDGQKQAFDYGVLLSGCTVHLVDTGTDTGPILAQAVVQVVEDDTRDSLAERILHWEHHLLPEVLRWFAEGIVVVERSAERTRPIVRVPGKQRAFGVNAPPTYRAKLPMSGRHYDVIVMGRGAGALMAGALLARRDFSVLVVGQGAKPISYHVDKYLLQRNPQMLLGTASPAWKRAMVELAQSQTFRRRVEPLDPMLSILMPGKRFELAPDLALFEREMDREFPEVRRIVDDLYNALARVNEAAEQTFQDDVVWPPGGFWERRKASNACSSWPYINSNQSQGPLIDFPALHPYRGVVEYSAGFATHLAGGARVLPAHALARLHAAWTRGPALISGGSDEFVQFLIDRITAHGGVVAINDKVEKIWTQGEKVIGVQLDGETGKTGCQFIITDLMGEDLAVLSQGEGITNSAKKEWPHIEETEGRFVVSIACRPEGIPGPLGNEAILFSQPFGVPADPQRPIVHLQRYLPPQSAHSTLSHALLLAEAIVPLQAQRLVGLREAVLRTVRQYFPWIERHLLAVDSAHDGQPAWVYQDGTRYEVERLKLTGATLRAEPMKSLYSVANPAFFGLAAEPLRGPINGTFLVGPSVLPALGQEGELLAGWSAAQQITKSDPRREKLRLELWSRVEIG